MSTRAMHAEKFTIPIVAMLEVRMEWELDPIRARDQIFAFKKVRSSGYKGADAFDVREEFLSLKSPEDASRFFERYGPFEYGYDKRTGRKSIAARPEAIAWQRLKRAQIDFEEALIADSIPIDRAWTYQFVVGRPLMLELRFRSISPELMRAVPGACDDGALATCHDVVDALRASIFLSRMKGFQWKRCARQDCNRLFQQETNHNKIFCKSECAHLQAVNDYNARKRSGVRRAKPRRRASR